MQRMMEEQRMCRSWGIFLTTIKCSSKGLMNNHEQPKKQLWILQVMTHNIKNQAYVICLVFWVCILSCGLGY